MTKSIYSSPRSGTLSDTANRPTTTENLEFFPGAVETDRSETACDSHQRDLCKRRLSYKGSLSGVESLQNRVESSVPCSIETLDWASLQAAVNVSSLKYHDKSLSHNKSLDGISGRKSTCTYVEISSGGTVFFLLFEQKKDLFSSSDALNGARDVCAVVKFISDRLLCQSEQFAAEITNHLGVDCPQSEIITCQSRSWKALRDAAIGCGKDCEELLECLDNNLSLLLLEHIPGSPLNTSLEAVAPSEIQHSSHTLGKILALDMILGNPDRLKCSRLSWPGNPSNLIYCKKGRFERKIVCIDAVVQRFPPHALTSSEDAACEEMAELAFNHVDFVFDVLENALFANSQFYGQSHISIDAAKACQRGMIETFRKAMNLRGIFEMLHQKIDEWIEEFVQDMETTHDTPLSPRDARSLQTPRGASATGYTSPQSATFMTHKIRSIQKEAGKDGILNEKLESWNNLLGEKSAELLLALNEWLQKNECQEQSMATTSNEYPKRGNGMKLTTAFLNANVRPVVDLYELKLRLRHVLRRLSIIGQALSSATPCMVFENVYVSGAVAANSFHVLRNIKITHMLNATEDLFSSGDPRSEYINQNFTSVLRIPLRDDDDEDISQYFETAAEFIESVGEGQNILVHCHIGQSRSCALVIAWLILKRGMTLREAVDLVQQARPQAAPNAGYMNALGQLEEKVHGKKTVKVRKCKPEPLTCNVCGMVVGLSRKTLKVHMKLKHQDTFPQAMNSTHP
jgi:predicted protein tyrosine phosphatase